MGGMALPLEGVKDRSPCFLEGEGQCRRFRLNKCRQILITERHCMSLFYGITNLT